jgi:hypothetical protein
VTHVAQKTVARFSTYRYYTFFFRNRESRVARPPPDCRAIRSPRGKADSFLECWEYTGKI